MLHIPATVASVEVKGLVDGKVVKGWKVVPKREAPADSKTAIKINLVQRSRQSIYLGLPTNTQIFYVTHLHTNICSQAIHTCTIDNQYQLQ